MFSKLGKIVLVMAISFMMSAGLHAAGGNIYLSTIFNENGSFQSRSLITFNKDGTLIISDSKQQGGFSSPFGLQQGYWEGHGDTLEFKSVNFTYPKYFTCDYPTGDCHCDDGICCQDCEESQKIAMLTGKLKKNEDGKWEGPLILTFFDLRADINDQCQSDGPLPAGTIVLDYICKP